MPLRFKVNCFQCGDNIYENEYPIARMFMLLHEEQFNHLCHIERIGSKTLNKKEKEKEKINGQS